MEQSIPVYIRRVEWNDFFNDEQTQKDTSEQETIRSKKLKTPKFSRPMNTLLTEENNTYVDFTSFQNVNSSNL